jgi:hypothetical protein
MQLWGGLSRMLKGCQALGERVEAALLPGSPETGQRQARLRPGVGTGAAEDLAHTYTTSKGGQDDDGERPLHWRVLRRWIGQAPARAGIASPDGVAVVLPTVGGCVSACTRASPPRSAASPPTLSSPGRVVWALGPGIGGLGRSRIGASACALSDPSKSVGAALVLFSLPVSAMYDRLKPEPGPISAHRGRMAGVTSSSSVTGSATNGLRSSARVPPRLRLVFSWIV